MSSDCPLCTVQIEIFWILLYYALIILEWLFNRNCLTHFSLMIVTVIKWQREASSMIDINQNYLVKQIDYVINIQYF